MKTPKDLSDEELIDLLKEDNHRYYSVLMSRYEAFILKKCNTYLKDEDEAEDMCQEILIRVFLQIPNFRKEAKFRTWLYTIIHHACIDFLRKKKRPIDRIISKGLQEKIQQIADLDYEISDQKSLEILEQLLEQISPEEKLLLLLKYREEQSILAISHSLQLSQSAVKMRLLRAREKLKKLFEATKS